MSGKTERYWDWGSENMKKLKGGIIGAGKDSFIGFVHRSAVAITGSGEIVAGVFSRDPGKSRKRGEELGLDPGRVYTDVRDMAARESSLPGGEGIDFVIVASPNNTHYEMTMAFLEAGINVFSDKPMAVSLDQSLEIQSKAREKGLLFALTHGYTGYAMTKQARRLATSGALGRIHRVVVEYTQGWLSPLLEDPKAFTTWHLDPEVSGPSCTMMDVGVHALNLLQTITGLSPREVCADLAGAIPGHRMDDHGSVLIHFDGEARGLLHASQVSSGEGNALRIRVYGTKGGLAWDQETPETLERYNPDGTSTIYKKGTPALCEDAQRAAMLPGGHPEGLISAFSNIYSAGFRYINGDKDVLPGRDFPDGAQGAAGLAFIEAILENNRSGEKWTPVRPVE